jgi:hypothetical protein
MLGRTLSAATDEVERTNSIVDLLAYVTLVTRRVHRHANLREKAAIPHVDLVLWVSPVLG